MHVSIFPAGQSTHQETRWRTFHAHAASCQFQVNIFSVFLVLFFKFRMTRCTPKKVDTHLNRATWCQTLIFQTVNSVRWLMVYEAGAYENFSEWGGAPIQSADAFSVNPLEDFVPPLKTLFLTKLQISFLSILKDRISFRLIVFSWLRTYTFVDIYQSCIGNQISSKTSNV